MGLPENFKKLVVKKLSTDFRASVAIESTPLRQLSDKEVLIKNKYVGVNATDVNITAGRYFCSGKPPYDIGFEGVGEIVAVGEQVNNIKVGQYVAYMAENLDAYAEYKYAEEKDLFPIPELSSKYVSLLVSGLTATIGLDKSGKITEDETVLVTAAAGGAGHIAVQWAKAAGCHVIATCSTQEKVDILKNLGCDRVINYKTEDLNAVLTKEYPKGIDVIWETIGGKVFETCINNLAVKGRLIIVGAITGYKTEEIMPKIDMSHVPGLLLFKSSAMQGFLVLHFKECFPTYFKYLCERTIKNELKIIVDDGQKTTGNEFVGLDGIIRAVEHLHSGKSIGKVTVRMS